MITSNLCWSVHQLVIRKKMVSTTGIIHIIGNILIMDCPKKLINAFVMPHVRYCIPVWGNSNARSAIKLNALLLRVAKLLLHDKTAELNTYEATGLMSFSSLLYLSNVCCISNFLQQNFLRNYTNTVLMRESGIQNKRSATSSKIQQLKHDRSADAYCLQVAGIKDWNSSPFQITNQTNFKNFETKVWLFFFSLDEHWTLIT